MKPFLLCKRDGSTEIVQRGVTYRLSSELQSILGQADAVLEWPDLRAGEEPEHRPDGACAKIIETEPITKLPCLCNGASMKIHAQ